MDLFTEQTEQARARVAPLAVRMRPQTLDDFVGQREFLGPGKLLRRLLDSDRLTSAIFFGPPGSGKTTLATIIAAHTRSAFESLHAAEAGVKDVRAVIERATARLAARGQRTVLFLDEIHRFSRTQQDSLLRDVEEGVLTLIGATTENPFFAINGPLLSRSQLFEFHPLAQADLLALLHRALADPARGLGALNLTCEAEALQFLAEQAAGDARRALTGLEIAAQSPVGPDRRITLAVAAESIQRKVIRHDATGDEHYDVVSAFIKSMRGSDPDAAVYWLARLLEAGEDPRFIARRICIAASEDVGNADPQAAILAAAAARITEFVGLPECQLTLAHAAIYVACAPKSNAVTRAIGQARADVRDGLLLPVPNHLRDRSYGGAERLGRGAGYDNPHDHPDGFAPQDYLGAQRVYYNPTQRGLEHDWAAQLAARRAQRRGAAEPATEQGA